MSRPEQVRATKHRRDDGRYVMTVYKDEFGLTRILEGEREAVQWACAQIAEMLTGNGEHGEGGEAA